MSISDSDKFEKHSENEATAESAVSSSQEDVSSVEFVASQLIGDPVSDIEFIMSDQEELVDLDALFDALNVAATNGVDAMDFVGNDGENSGILTVTNEALAATGVASTMDDLGASAGDIIIDPVISDES